MYECFSVLLLSEGADASCEACGDMSKWQSRWPSRLVSSEPVVSDTEPFAPAPSVEDRVLPAFVFELFVASPYVADSAAQAPVINELLQASPVTFCTAQRLLVAKTMAAVTTGASCDDTGMTSSHLEEFAETVHMIRQEEVSERIVDFLVPPIGEDSDEEFRMTRSAEQILDFLKPQAHQQHFFLCIFFSGELHVDEHVASPSS